MDTTTIINLSVRRCPRCVVEKPVEEFQWKNRARGIRRSWCRPCALAYSRQHYLDNIEKYKAKARARRPRVRLRNRMLVDDYLSAHPCVDCGTADIAILEFDHRDPSQKRDSVSRLAMSASWAPVLREIEKCEVRCANCHRQRTARQFGWTKTRPLPKPASMQPIAVAARMEPDLDFVKECRWCYLLKPLSEFAFRSTSRRTLSSHCRGCHAQYRHQHYAVNREHYFRQAYAQARRNSEDKHKRLRDYLLSHPCVDCGATDISTLEFDHVDPATKEMEVARLIRRRNWRAVEREIAKCVVRCANCHRRRTIAQWREGSMGASHLQSATLRE